MDYEVFGNGSGCIQRCLIEPANQLMACCESKGVRLTFFVDMSEYWAFDAAEKNALLPDGECPATLIRQQLKEMIRRGHDVQLHLHPQWTDATYHPENGWHVNLAYWRLPMAPGGYGTREDKRSILGMIHQGRTQLESLLQEVDPDYRCTAFRGGAWSLQPEEEVLRALIEGGMRFDTTVAPGCSFDNCVTVYDFRPAPVDQPFWHVTNRLNYPDSQGTLTEVPIFTFPVQGVRRIFWRLSARRAGRDPNALAPSCLGSFPAAAMKESAWSLWRQRFKRLFVSRAQMMDFCNSTLSELKAGVDYAQKQQLNGADAEKPAPLVTIGHTKTFNDPERLGAFLDWVKAQPGVAAEYLSEPYFWRTGGQ